MICSNCGSPNEPGRKFCGECGTRLAATCPNCGSPNSPGTRFCGECGTALAEPVPGGPVASMGMIVRRCPEFRDGPLPANQ